MGAVGLAALVIGYALAYSGVSQIMTGGQGMGFLEALTGRAASSNNTSGIDSLFGGGGTSNSPVAGLKKGLKDAKKIGSNPIIRGIPGGKLLKDLPNAIHGGKVPSNSPITGGPGTNTPNMG